MTPPPCLQNSSLRNPNVLRIPVNVTPPSPLEFRDAARGMGMDIFWNHPILEISAFEYLFRASLAVYLKVCLTAPTLIFLYS